MLNNQDIFYFATIRKITAAFGTIFDDVRISRYSNNAGSGTVLKTIRVPFAYAEGQKWLSHLREDVTSSLAVTTPSNRKTRVRKSLPRMSFELTSLQYDANRKLQTLGAIKKSSNTDVNILLKQLNPIPYDIGYDLNIAVANIDDGLQILEQILPNFAPSWNLTVNDIPELGIVRDVPVIFGGISKQDTYQGSYEEERIITWTLSFVVKGYIYPMIRDASIIKTVIDNIYTNNDMENKDAIVTVAVDPIDADITDDYEVETHIYEGDQIDSNGDPIEDSNS